MQSEHQSGCGASERSKSSHLEFLQKKSLSGGSLYFGYEQGAKSEKLEPVAMFPSGVTLGAAASSRAALSGKPRGLCADTSGPGWTQAPVQNPVFPSGTCLPAEPRAHLSDPSPQQLRDTCHR